MKHVISCWFAASGGATTPDNGTDASSIVTTTTATGAIGIEDSPLHLATEEGKSTSKNSNILSISSYIFSEKILLRVESFNPFIGKVFWTLWINEVLLNFLFFFAANTAGETSGAPHNAEIRIIPQSAATIVNVAPPTYEESC